MVSNAVQKGLIQGLSIIFTRLQVGTLWYGNDFNPAQLRHAQDLAAVSGANIHLMTIRLPNFSQGRDLPQFDSISLHGI